MVLVWSGWSLLYARDHLLVRCRDDQVVTKRTYASVITTAILSAVILFPFIASAAGMAYGLEGDPPAESSVPADAPSAEPTPSEAPSEAPSEGPSLSPEETTDPSPEPSQSAEPSETPEPSPSGPEPQPQVPQWNIGDPANDLPPVRIEIPAGYSPENQIPIVDQSGNVKGPGAYAVISDGVLLGNYMFDPVASRQLLEMMRSPDCGFGPFCGAVIVPSDGTTNPGTPIVP